MNNYVVFSDRYKHLVKPYSMLVEKYWKNEPIIFLGYALPDIELPDHHTLISIAPIDTEYSWCSGLRKYFSSVDDEYFTILLEDMLPVCNVAIDDIALAEQEIKLGADKVVLYTCDQRYAHYSERMVLLRQKTEYRATLHPAMWRREYFLECLEGIKTPWQFELKKGFNDGKKILAFYPRDNVEDPYYNKPFSCNNVYRHGGKLAHKSINKLCEEDRAMLMEHLPCEQ